MYTRYIQRHSWQARFTHNVAAVCCLLLAVSGLFVFIPSWNNAVGSEVTIAIRWTHRVLAIPFILIPVISFFWSLKGAKHLFFNNIFGRWDKDDYTFAKLFIPYLFAPSKIHMPPQREVKSMQRVADGLLLFACVFAAISGIIMWLQTGLLPGGEWSVHFSAETFRWARLVHDISFLLIVLFGIGHIYLGAGIFQPYRGTARLMWGDGKVDESDAGYHWGYWADAELASGKNVVKVEDGQGKTDRRIGS